MLFLPARNQSGARLCGAGGVGSHCSNPLRSTPSGRYQHLRAASQRAPRRWACSCSLNGTRSSILTSKVCTAAGRAARHIRVVFVDLSLALCQQRVHTLRIQNIGEILHGHRLGEVVVEAGLERA
jgi:hypothetical protein